MKLILIRLSKVLLFPILIILAILFYVICIVGCIIVDPFVWLITGKTFVMRYMDNNDI